MPGTTRHAVHDEDDASLDSHPFLDSPAAHYKRPMLTKPPALACIGLCISLIAFMLGYTVGRSDHRLESVLTGLTAQMSGLVTTLQSSAKLSPAQSSLAGNTATVFDSLQSLPPIDLYKEYGLVYHKNSLYPQPLGSKVCIVNADTRKWDPEQHKDLQNMEPLQWGYLNHYIYARLHGYTFKHVQVPKQKGLHDTWVKVRELYRITVRSECQFVIMMDGDIIFNDIRIPMEALLSHWNITQDITIAGGIDVDKQVDAFGRIVMNSGFLITQQTPLADGLMQDWINCPSDVKYENCSHWKDVFAHEQSAFSNHIRYDKEYKDSIREIPVEDVHLGRFTKHYWGAKHKPEIEKGVKETFLQRFLPDTYKELLSDWSSIHEHPTLGMYEAIEQRNRSSV